MERPNAWKTYKKTDLKKVEQTAAEYRRFLDSGKTERECAKETVEMLEKAGYVSLQSAIEAGKKLKPGDKEYEKIKNSIEEFGFADPLVVNSDMTIIGGHQRLTVAMDLGYTDVPCAVVDIDNAGIFERREPVAHNDAFVVPFVS